VKPAIVGGALVAVTGDCLIALAGPPLPAIPLLLVGRLLAGAGLPLFVVNAVSLRQAITPAPLLGRVAAGIRSITWGVLPVGALLGGLLGEHIGLRPTLLVAACGSLTQSSGLYRRRRSPAGVAALTESLLLLYCTRVA
jgi:hypothetical protein